ncbi:hypothetical protein [Rhizobium sp. PP-F2F-G48]|uniref:hypothetical protein n=1 Tax=Rhizobium sp. PP-F2F-G48 TaxID=2135651 RepID=UPI0010478EFA|nr:hypothetical protein [Rhizobium sp. PP-F2F-G48]
MKSTKQHQKELTKWVVQIFCKKAEYELNLKYRINNNKMTTDYVSDSTYSVTVILKNSALTDIRFGQEKLQREFNHYLIRHLGPKLMDRDKLDARNLKYAPLCFLSFDIEGTRYNSFDVQTESPHGHGAVMFHEATVYNFTQANKQFLQEDGSYKINNPTPGIAQIEFRRLPSVADLARFIDYSLKFAVKLKSNQTNGQPYNFYPASSASYPFWKHLSMVDDAAGHVKAVVQKAENGIERLRVLENIPHRIRRGIGRNGSGKTPRHPTI